MSLTVNNLQTISDLLTTLSQRNATINELAQRLHSGTVWRSQDGKLAVGITDAQRADLERFIDTYLKETEVIILAIRGFMGSKEQPAADVL